MSEEKFIDIDNEFISRFLTIKINSELDLLKNPNYPILWANYHAKEVFPKMSISLKEKNIFPEWISERYIQSLGLYPSSLNTKRVRNVMCCYKLNEFFYLYVYVIYDLNQINVSAGIEMRLDGKEKLISKITIDVNHLAQYGFFDIERNDFIKPISWACEKLISESEYGDVRNLI